MEAQKRNQQIKHNLELLRATFHVLNHMVKESASERSGLGNCNALTLSVAQKLVYERWEREKRNLGEFSYPVSDVFAPAEPIFTEEQRLKMVQEIKETPFYRAAWGSPANIAKK
jgi:hypothetical protein